MRASIKHAMKRGEGLDSIKKKYFEQKTHDAKKLIKSWYLLIHDFLILLAEINNKYEKFWSH